MKLEPVSKITPRLVPSSPGPVKEARVWEALVPRLLHPTKLLVVEALLWLGEPMSAIGLSRMLDDPGYSGGVISYHLRVMAEAGVLMRAGRRSVRGAEELFFYFPPAEEDSDRSQAGTGAKR